MILHNIENGDGLKVEWINIRHLRYADDTILTAISLNIQQLLNFNVVSYMSKTIYFSLGASKTECMCFQEFHLLPTL